MVAVIRSQAPEGCQHGFLAALATGVKGVAHIVRNGFERGQGRAGLRRQGTLLFEGGGHAKGGGTGFGEARHAPPVVGQDVRRDLHCQDGGFATGVLAGRDPGLDPDYATLARRQGEVCPVEGADVLDEGALCRGRLLERGPRGRPLQNQVVGQFDAQRYPGDGVGPRVGQGHHGVDAPTCAH